MKNWRGAPISMSLYNKITSDRFLAVHKEREKSSVERWEIVTEEMIGITFKIYTGKRWFYRFIMEADVGFKFGEFAETRVPFAHLRRRRLKKRARQQKKKTWVV